MKVLAVMVLGAIITGCVVLKDTSTESRIEKTLDSGPGSGDGVFYQIA